MFDVVLCSICKEFCPTMFFDGTGCDEVTTIKIVVDWGPAGGGTAQFVSVCLFG
jgi:hypothetical protein